ncbi:MAG: hypothetical protein H6Q94_127, partial [Nitrospirae bacterium]|nr:hypothetical protein [Nitrospirota bacterium]
FNKHTKVVVSTQKILPAPVSTGLEVYPENILEQLEGKGVSVFPVDAFEIAQSIGESRASNVVLTGALSVFLPVEEKIFLDVIEKRIPEKILRVNREAFLRGREISKKTV